MFCCRCTSAVVLMQSRDPLDPTRLSVLNVDVTRPIWREQESEGTLCLSLTLRYETWWGPQDGMNVLWEYINALQCLRLALEKGGVTHD